ncbi:MAG: PP0621 family protein [Proteobacteria bacterium]|nr:PP0621 family protein [Pseudomonadota bacterium]MDA0949481.1 PP0621 family protein [Pseudomonadota bacterium]MDA1083664.1 PP0621 family protein [Pseudomonadota bacterium]MDC1241334.1 PP0621 family protein [Gammaproteobacteria bacterium]
MVFLKILPLLIPLLIFLLPMLFRTYLKSAFMKKSKKKNELMVVCSKCGTYAHESIIIKKNGMHFCSKECINK